MQLSSLGLLLIAAFLHAGANALMKQARDKLAFTWWMLGASTALGLPVLLFVGGPRDTIGWTLVTVSGCIEAVYFWTLSRAYALGELSQVYPIARGSAQFFIVAWANLFRHERPSPMGLCGILTIVLGVYFVNLPSLSEWRRPLAGFREPALRWALLTGVLISMYFTVDKFGVEHTEPAAYLVLILAVGWLVLSLQWLSRHRRQALIGEIAASKCGSAGLTRLRIIAGAFCGNAAYLLVLMALRQDKASYIGAVREISVVIGAWIGVQFFAESGGRVRLLASGLVGLGILLIAVGG